MLLSDRDILAEVTEGRIALEPWNPTTLQPSSINVRLDWLFRVFGDHRYPRIDPVEERLELTQLIGVGDEGAFVLRPGEFVPGSTWEQVSLPVTVAARLEGKSSLGQLGLLTHSTVGFIDPGLSGHVTLELLSTAILPVKLWPGMKIGQLCFFRPSSEARHLYGSKEYGSRHQGQRSLTPSRFHLNFHRTKVQNSVAGNDLGEDVE